jgi:glycosyltransferase involved in cell wall biosynthesis
MSEKIHNVSIIIPSLNPDEKLELVVSSLIDTGFKDIIILDDGSDESHKLPFENLKKYNECTVLKHDQNMGKGRALKDAFTYVLENRTDIVGVITVDGDNQHQAKDIKNCAIKLLEQVDKVILGVRDFSGKEIPFKSKFGNKLTSFIFKFACGINITDTQTGLRAIPFGYLSEFIEVKGERFEYETNMLLLIKALRIDIVEVKIQTVYINENETTHFHPIRDSFKIYKIILHFIMSSLMSSVIDITAFGVLTSVILNDVEKSNKILFATILARVVSSMFNFMFNKKAVFKSDESFKKSFFKYYILCIIQMMTSYGLVYLTSDILNLGNGFTTVSKGVIDTLLFFVSFRIQKAWVFKK